MDAKDFIFKDYWGGSSMSQLYIGSLKCSRISIEWANFYFFNCAHSIIVIHELGINLEHLLYATVNAKMIHKTSDNLLVYTHDSCK